MAQRGEEGVERDSMKRGWTDQRVNRGEGGWMDQWFDRGKRGLDGLRVRWFVALIRWMA